MRSMLFLLLTPILLASCGAESKPAPSANSDLANLDACDLFPADEANAIVGGYVSGMSSTLEDAKGRDPLSCAYNAGSTEQPSILSLVVRLYPSPQRAERMLEASRDSLEKLTQGDLREVPNLGDGAFWAGGNLQQLHVRKAEKQLVITCQLPDPAASFAGAQKIAQAALGRL